MSSSSRPRQDPGLFDDLPLQPEAPRSRKPSSTANRKSQTTPEPPSAPVAESLPLFSDDTEPDAISAETRPAWRPVVPLSAHLTAGLVDLLAMLGVLLIATVGLWWLGVEIDPVGWALVMVFLVPFSFLYQIFPLAFWGRTPGMARIGIVARNPDGEVLSFSQATLRWLASVVTVALAGLPWIVTAVTGRSLADRFSGSVTLPAK